MNKPCCFGEYQNEPTWRKKQCEIDPPCKHLKECELHSKRERLCVGDVKQQKKDLIK